MFGNIRRICITYIISLRWFCRLWCMHVFVPSAVYRDDSCAVQFLDAAVIIVAWFYSQALYVLVTCSAQCKSHWREACIATVWPERHQSRAFDGMALRGRMLQKRAKMHRGAHMLHALPEGTTCKWVHGPHQETSRITLNLHTQVFGEQQ